MDRSPDRDLAARGFADGTLYDSARPDYPRAALEHFAAALRLGPSTRALDLGAGSGIFTRQIRPYVGPLIAVDPSASMRETLASSTSGVEVLDGCDVAIPLEDASVDAVFVAQAFHWFDAPRALVEMRRVLAPDGALGLIWNERDESVDWVSALSAAMRWGVNLPYDVGRDFCDTVAAGPFRDVARATFPHSQTLTREGLYRRVRTTSYIAVMDDPARAELMRAVAEVVEALAEPIVLPYLTAVYCARAA
jgi:SAM-dependent methyltransferase